MTGDNDQGEKRWVVPMSAPDLGEAEREAVAAVLRTPRLSMGPQVEAFERAIARVAEARFAVAVNSGTAGLHLCVRAAGISDGDRVITTPFSFISSANVLLFERAVPIFVDVEPRSGNIDAQRVDAVVRDLVGGGDAAKQHLPRKGVPKRGDLKALLPVDVFGQPADYDRLNETAQRHGLVVVEDSCEALGASYRGRPAGTLGDAGVFAFYPNKQITTGEGGVVVTNREDWGSLVRALSNQGRAQGDMWLQHSHLGYNYRMDEMSAALGRAQAARLPELLQKRDRVAGWYQERLSEMPRIEVPSLTPTTTRMSWFVYVARLHPEVDRRALVERLAEQGVPTRPYFNPIHLQPYFVERFGYREGDFPVAEDLGRRSLALPFSSVMDEQQVDFVCQALLRSLRGD